MWIKTIKDYKDKETKDIHRASEQVVREVSDERGCELVTKGFAVEMLVSIKEVENNKAKANKENAKKKQESEVDVTEETKVEFEGDISE